MTGGTDGIGAEYARQIAAMGQNIIIVGRNHQKLTVMKTEINEKYKVQVETIQADLSQQDETAKAVAKVKALSSEREIGVLVNNAGVAYEHPEYFHLIRDSEEKLNSLVNVNCASLVQFTAAVIGAMAERKKGLIINIGSGTGDMISPLLSLYAATKAYVHHFTRCLRYEYEPLGIHVQLISPHVVSTKMSKARPGLFMPTPEKFVYSALSSATRLQSTCGFFLHDLAHSIRYIMPEFLFVKLVKNMSEGLRQRHYKKNKAK